MSAPRFPVVTISGQPVSGVLAARRSSLFTRRDARAAGFSDDQIRRRIARGDWRVVLGPVLGPAGLRIGPAVLDVAAWLAVRGAVLAGPSAARTYGLPVPDAGTYLLVPPGRHVRLPGVRTLREIPGPREVTGFEGMRVSSRSRAVFDCLRLLPEDAAETFLDRALQQGWIAFPDLVALSSQAVGRVGIGRLVRLVRKAADGTRSHAERTLAAALRAARINGWTAGYPVRVAGRFAAEVDVAFPAVRLAVEVDGQAFHITPDRFERDRARQNQLVAAGWTVLRFTWTDLSRRPTQVIETIQATLPRLRPS